MSQEPEFTVTDWRPLRKGTSLRGFVTLTLPSGMIVHDVTYHQRDDDRAAHSRFQTLAKAAIDHYFARGAGREDDGAVAGAGKPVR